MRRMSRLNTAYYFKVTATDSASNTTSADCHRHRDRQHRANGLVSCAKRYNIGVRLHRIQYYRDILGIHGYQLNTGLELLPGGRQPVLQNATTQTGTWSDGSGSSVTNDTYTVTYSVTDAGVNIADVDVLVGTSLSRCRNSNALASTHTASDVFSIEQDTTAPTVTSVVFQDSSGTTITTVCQSRRQLSRSSSPSASPWIRTGQTSTSPPTIEVLTMPVGRQWHGTGSTVKSGQAGHRLRPTDGDSNGIPSIPCQLHRARSRSIDTVGRQSASSPGRGQPLMMHPAMPSTAATMRTTSRRRRHTA